MNHLVKGLLLRRVFEEEEECVEELLDEGGFAVDVQVGKILPKHL